MTRSIYNIWMKEGKKDLSLPIHGTTFLYGGLRFGISHSYLIKQKGSYIEESQTRWTITELTTGAAVFSRTGRKMDVINEFIKNKNRLHAIKSGVKMFLDEKNEDRNKDIIIKNQILSVH